MLLGQSSFQASECVVDKRFIAVTGHWVDGIGLKGLICVYAPTKGREILEFFEALTHFC